MSLFQHLDFTTSYLFASAVQLAIAAAALTIVSAQKTYAGFGRWMGGYFAAAIGFALVSTRGALPAPVSVLAGGLVFITATPLQVDGLLQFLEADATRLRRGLNLAVCVVSMALYLGCYSVFPSPRLEALALSGGIAACAALALASIRRSSFAGRIPALRILLTCYGTEIALHLFRLVRIIGPDGGESAMDEGTLALGALLCTLLLMLKAFGLVALNSQRLEQEWRVMHRDLEQLASTDALTKLRNRHAFMEQGHALFAFSSRHKRPLTALLIDIDHFKRVNDTHGHATGDTVLTMVADMMVATLRHSDVIGRIGGEEFAVILMEAPRDSAEATAERLRRNIETMAPPWPGNDRVTISIGLAALVPDVPDLDSLMARADEALYKAKRAGRNRWIAAE